MKNHALPQNGDIQCVARLHMFRQDNTTLLISSDNHGGGIIPLFAAESSSRGAWSWELDGEINIKDKKSKSRSPPRRTQTA